MVPIDTPLKAALHAQEAHQPAVQSGRGLSTTTTPLKLASEPTKLFLPRPRGGHTTVHAGKAEGSAALCMP